MPNSAAFRRRQFSTFRFFSGAAMIYDDFQAQAISAPPRRFLHERFEI